MHNLLKKTQKPELECSGQFPRKQGRDPHCFETWPLSEEGTGFLISAHKQGGNLERLNQAQGVWPHMQNKIENQGH